ncbi:hypothetical protein ACFWXK_15630 [Streptomyces sp. NPDC059070]|uniref:hypothetical protein n=1 Tax=Streptomyces sp. NPDC059070 TaxID=3346713 RepID=UPI0036A77318
MPDPRFFDTDERTEAALAASRLMEALHVLGVDLDNFDLADECPSCRPTGDLCVSLGSYRPAVLSEAAEKLEVVARKAERLDEVTQLIDSIRATT